MASGRMLNRSIAKSHDVATLIERVNEELGFGHGAQAAIVFTWALPFLDREGRMHGDPRLVKSEIAPLVEGITAKEVAVYLRHMHEIGLIVWYRGDDGRMWVAYPKFDDQQPNLRKDREQPSVIPPPSSHGGAVPELLRRDSGADPGEEKRREEKRTEAPRLPPPRGHQQVLLVEDPPKDPPKRKTSQKRGEFEPSEGGRRVLDELNRRRMRSVPNARELAAISVNLVEIEARLSEGHAVDELLHVCAVAEGKYRRDQASQYFNATTPFRAANIARYLAEPKPEIRVARSLPAPAPGSEPMRAGLDEYFEANRHKLPSPEETYAALLELEAEEAGDA